MKITERPLSDLYNEYLNEFSFKDSLYLKYGDIAVRVVINDERLFEKLAGYFREFIISPLNYDITIYAAESEEPETDLNFKVKQPDLGKKKIKEEYFDLPDGRIIRKVLTGMFFLIGNSHNIAIGPCTDNYNQIVNFINSRFIEKKLNQQYLLYHASAICCNKKGIAISGFSGAGKSTLALYLMTHNFNFVSNDRLLIKNEGDRLTMNGVIKYPRINPGTIVSIDEIEDLIPEVEREDLKSLSLEDLWNIEKKYDLFIDAIYGMNKFHLKADLSGLVILNWRRNGEPVQINEIDIEKREDLFAAFMKSPGLFYINNGASPDFSVASYARQLKGRPVFEVTGGVDFNMVSEYFAEFLNRGVF